jgi:predicted transcriptional regulator
MSEERPIFEDIDPAAEDAAIERAMEDYRAGRVVPHAEVAKWLREWSKNPDLRVPREWLR